MKPNLADRVLEWFRVRPGKVRAPEQLAAALGNPNYSTLVGALQRLVKQGALARLGYGQYRLQDANAPVVYERRGTRQWLLRIADEIDIEIEILDAEWARAPETAHYFTREAVKIGLTALARVVRRVSV